MTTLIQTLKSYPKYFNATLGGVKKHELRHKDEFQFLPFPGDLITLEEFDQDRGDHGEYTGQVCLIEVTWVSPTPEALKPDYIAFSFKLRKPWYKLF